MSLLRIETTCGPAERAGPTDDGGCCCCLLFVIAFIAIGFVWTVWP